MDVAERQKFIELGERSFLCEEHLAGIVKEQHCKGLCVTCKDTQRISTYSTYIAQKSAEKRDIR